MEIMSEEKFAVYFKYNRIICL